MAHVRAGREREEARAGRGGEGRGERKTEGFLERQLQAVLYILLCSDALADCSFHPVTCEECRYESRRAWLSQVTGHGSQVTDHKSRVSGVCVLRKTLAKRNSVVCNSAEENSWADDGCCCGGSVAELERALADEEREEEEVRRKEEGAGEG
eukprot:3099751-Rhodomonas_salina.1